jgi:hypothetical protein
LSSTLLQVADRCPQSSSTELLARARPPSAESTFFHPPKKRRRNLHTATTWRFNNPQLSKSLGGGFADYFRQNTNRPDPAATKDCGAAWRKKTGKYDLQQLQKKTIVMSFCVNRIDGYGGCNFTFQSAQKLATIVWMAAEQRRPKFPFVATDAADEFATVDSPPPQKNF